MVDFGSGPRPTAGFHIYFYVAVGVQQAAAVLKPQASSATSRIYKRENAGLDRKMPFMDGH
jgi:hypothetical protein